MVPLAFATALLFAPPASPSAAAEDVDRWLAAMRRGDAAVHLWSHDQWKQVLQAGRRFAPLSGIAASSSHAAAFVDWAYGLEPPPGDSAFLRAGDRARLAQLFFGPAVFARWWDLESRLDRAAREASPEALDALLRAAVFDFGRGLGRRQWERLRPARPFFVRREARAALLRVDRRVLLRHLIDRARPGAPEPLGFAALDLLADRVEAGDLGPLPAGEAFLERLALARLRHGRSVRERVAAGRLLAALRLDAAAPAGPRLIDPLLRLVRPDTPPLVLRAALQVLSAEPVERVPLFLARRLAEERGFCECASDDLRAAIARMVPSAPVDGPAAALVEWLERESAGGRWARHFELWRLRRAAREASPEPRYGSFLGIPIVGRRVALVIDVSGSMSEFIQEQTSATRKIDRAIAELDRTIAALPDGVRFDVITFESEAQSLLGRMRRADARIRRTARKAVARLDAEGSTNLHAALALAFGVGRVGQPVEGGSEERRPDQVIVLGDGEPTTGWVVDPLALLEETCRIARTMGTRIDTVALGDDADVALLGAMARRNGGVCVEHPRRSR